MHEEFYFKEIHQFVKKKKSFYEKQNKQNKREESHLDFMIFLHCNQI